MAMKPGERRLSILQMLASMLENPRSEKGDDRSARCEARRFRGGPVPPFREQGADVRRD